MNGKRFDSYLITAAAVAAAEAFAAVVGEPFGFDEIFARGNDCKQLPVAVVVVVAFAFVALTKLKENLVVSGVNVIPAYLSSEFDCCDPLDRQVEKIRDCHRDNHQHRIQASSLVACSYHLQQQRPDVAVDVADVVDDGADSFELYSHFAQP